MHIDFQTTPYTGSCTDLKSDKLAPFYLLICYFLLSNAHFHFQFVGQRCLRAFNSVMKPTLVLINLNTGLVKTRSKLKVLTT
jgi:hypothetical protein